MLITFFLTKGIVCTLGNHFFYMYSFMIGLQNPSRNFFNYLFLLNTRLFLAVFALKKLMRFSWQKNKPLTKEQKEYNREVVACVRARVEHVFGRLSYCMGGMTIRLIGISRAKCQCALRDFAYNLMRYMTLVKLGKAQKMAA